MDHCLGSSNYVNVIVADKQDHLQYLTMDEAVEHCTKGIGIWQQFSTDAGEEPDLIMASCGDIATNESLAAIDLLLQNFPELKIRCINVVDLFKLIHHDEHPHGLKDREWSSLFTDDKPVIMNFHSYPWLVHRLVYRRPGSHNIHVRGMLLLRLYITWTCTNSLQATRRKAISTPPSSLLFAMALIGSVSPWTPLTTCLTYITAARLLVKSSRMLSWLPVTRHLTLARILCT